MRARLGSVFVALVVVTGCSAESEQADADVAGVITCQDTTGTSPFYDPNERWTVKGTKSTTMLVQFSCETQRLGPGCSGSIMGGCASYPAGKVVSASVACMGACRAGACVD